MSSDYETPMLLRFLYGEAARIAQRDASERLLRWCRAYEDWLAERRVSRPSTIVHANQAWRRFLGNLPKMPWDFTPEDIEAHKSWMQKHGYAPATISNNMSYLSDFYRWCSQNQIDPDIKSYFNPLQDTEHPKYPSIRGDKMLSIGQVSSLLDFMRRDKTALGSRDYAFILARLRLGVPLGWIRELKWGQIEHDEQGAWVRWSADLERYLLSVEVWEAINSSLDIGGRLAHMQDNDYIFAPLAEPPQKEVGFEEKDWQSHKPISTKQLRLNLKHYGSLVDIPQDKLNFLALRRTALRIRLDDGASLDEMQVFQGARKIWSTKSMIMNLPHLPVDDELRDKNNLEGLSLPDRKGKPYKPGDNFVHGFYAASLPSDHVVEIIQMDIQGFDEEFSGLRILGRELIKRMESSDNRQEKAKLGEAYTLVAYRISEMVEAEKKLAEKNNSEREAKEFLEMQNQAAESMHAYYGTAPTQEEQTDPEWEVSTRALFEEVAAVRLVIRNIFELAVESGDIVQYIYMVDLYGRACMRLVKLLSSEVSYASMMMAMHMEAYERAIRDFWEHLETRINFLDS